MSIKCEVAIDLESLRDLSGSELELRGLTLLGGAQAKQLPKFLQARLLAYRIQERQSGGLSKAASRYLAQVADELAAGHEPDLPYPSDQKLMSGSVIVREHDGILHRVMVLEDGFAWNGKIYGSLSAVAKAMTGTNWNGRRFFGLKTKVKKEKCREVAP